MSPELEDKFDQLRKLMREIEILATAEGLRQIHATLSIIYTATGLMYCNDFAALAELQNKARALALASQQRLLRLN